MTAEMRPTDERWMRRALELARRGEGRTRPNPPVGAVVVRGGRVVGEGFHARAGTAHAERVALAAAGDAARGGVLYVTLEPCSTHGRTPPCVDAILAAGIRRVVAAIPDPNPRHAGRGFRLLRRAGVRVDVGVGRSEAEEILRPFARWIQTGRPWLVLKLGLSLDGRIADAAGRSRWITGVAARQRVHAERRRSDAIMVGVGTVLADDPSLRPRPTRGRRPWRVIVDTHGRTPLGARVLTDGAADRTLIAVGRGCPAPRQESFRAAGATVAVIPTGPDGRVSLQALLACLGRMGVLRVLCEGGGELAASLIDGGHADELLWICAPLVLGGTGIPAVGGRGHALSRAPRWRIVEATRLGGDLMVRAWPVRRK